MIRHVSSWTVIACSAFLSLSQPVAAQPPLAGERVATVTAIPEVIGADATWELVWADLPH
jgi:hypothetical protein